MAEAAPEAVGLVIHSTGFYRTKALHLVGLSKLLLEQHGGKVPESMEELLELPGVGRKTANLVLSSCFGQPGIIVDTHVLRVALRLGIEDRRDPLLVEKAIAANLEKAGWTAFSHAVNRHGKWVCTARKPGCDTCPIGELCPRIGVESLPPSH
jgi:endonuclease-3